MSVNYNNNGTLEKIAGNGENVVNVVQNNNMNPVTSNAVYKNWKKKFGQAITVTPIPIQSSVTNCTVSDAMVVRDGDGVEHNLGTGGSHAFYMTWTTNGYLVFIVDVTVVFAVKGGTILTN